jgi:hypothetical protein
VDIPKKSVFSRSTRRRALRAAQHVLLEHFSIAFHSAIARLERGFASFAKIPYQDVRTRQDLLRMLDEFEIERIDGSAKYPETTPRWKWVSRSSQGIQRRVCRGRVGVQTIIVVDHRARMAAEELPCNVPSAETRTTFPTRSTRSSGMGFKLIRIVRMCHGPMFMLRKAARPALAWSSKN